MEFSHELALALVQSDKQFSVDFDDTWQWLNTVQLGKDSGAWTKELTAPPNLKLPRQFLPQIQRLFAYQVGNRQLLLGEGGGR